uniref:EF-hand domain-containing protein n=1 Tax=Alexandrium monilatum TaxID=311494 RepID=A0A7S4RMS0_9DINO
MEGPGASAAAVLGVLRALVEQCGASLGDVLGQILFRHRRAEPLQGSMHRATTEDASWIDGHDDLREVYRACTRKDHGRMRRSQWLKIVQLIQRNPVLRTKVRHADADRLFYSITTRNKDPNRTISINEFMQLLLMLIETSGLHPWMIFFSVGAHAKQLAAEAQAGGWD